MSRTLIEQFEPALIHRMMRLRANVDRFADGDEFGGYRFLHGGMPSEWRTNLHLALKSLTRLERGGEASAEVEETREVIYSVLSAMRRSDNPALHRVLRYAIDHWSVPKPFAFPEPPPEDLLHTIAVEVADAYAPDCSPQ